MSNLVYHMVFPAKYRRVVIDEIVDRKIREICLEIEKRYDYIKFLEIGTDQDHVHFLIQSTPNYAPSKIVRTIKSITARQIFLECPQVKKTIMGRRVLDRRIFCINSRKKSKRNSNKRVCKKSR